jgi:hypothetical protein
MANEEQANLAREQHADFLRDLGAHGITIDEMKQRGEKTFAVIALFDHQPEEIPDTLEIKRGKKVMTVPLVARVAKKFKPE